MIAGSSLILFACVCKYIVCFTTLMCVISSMQAGGGGVVYIFSLVIFAAPAFLEVLSHLSLDSPQVVLMHLL